MDLEFMYEMAEKALILGLKITAFTTIWWENL
jgi:hypothetical protein